MVQIGADGNSKSLIQVRRLAKSYRRGNEELHVLQGIDLDIDQGDFVTFMGPSGSGKTTLLNLVGDLDVPSSGTVTVVARRSAACRGPSSPTGGPATWASSSRCTA